MDAQQWEQDATEKQQKVAELEQEVQKVQQELQQQINSFKVRTLWQCQHFVHGCWCSCWQLVQLIEFVCMLAGAGMCAVWGCV
jgi:CO dehydrogenase nickel-insertion accessory protein CooC1